MSIEPALRQRTIALVGLMGAGKSSIGRRLAHALGLPFIDADEEVERAAARSISDIFEELGEAAFRDGERRVIARLLEEPPHVLATGGGAFMNAGHARSDSAESDLGLAEGRHGGACCAASNGAATVPCCARATRARCWSSSPASGTRSTRRPTSPSNPAKTAHQATVEAIIQALRARAARRRAVAVSGYAVGLGDRAYEVRRRAGADRPGRRADRAADDRRARGRRHRRHRRRLYAAAAGGRRWPGPGVTPR